MRALHRSASQFVARPAMIVTVSLLFLALRGTASAQQPLETETARLPAQGTLLTALTYEFQTSPQGAEHAIPLALEYGLTNRLAILVEPVVFTSIRPSTARSVMGVGDLEATLQLLVREEHNAWPALAVAAEVKIPTARDTLIGTGRANFTPYVIVSKAFGATEAHANVSYSFVGKPRNVAVQNSLGLALAFGHHQGSRLDLLAEFLSSTASGLGAPESTTAPEIAGAEQVGMEGFRYTLRRSQWLSFGITYDTANAPLLRPGFTIETRSDGRSNARRYTRAPQARQCVTPTALDFKACRTTGDLVLKIPKTTFRCSAGSLARSSAGDAIAAPHGPQTYCPLYASGPNHGSRAMDGSLEIFSSACGELRSCSAA